MSRPFLSCAGHFSHNPAIGFCHTLSRPSAYPQQTCPKHTHPRHPWPSHLREKSTATVAGDEDRQKRPFGEATETATALYTLGCLGTLGSRAPSYDRSPEHGPTHKHGPTQKHPRARSDTQAAADTQASALARKLDGFEYQECAMNGVRADDHCRTMQMLHSGLTTTSTSSLTHTSTILVTNLLEKGCIAFDIP